jgi:bilirubin oxidase
MATVPRALILALTCMAWPNAPATLSRVGAGASLRAGHAAASAILRQPPVLPNLSARRGVVEVSITAAPVRLQLVPGGPIVDAYAYNGTIPGPTLEAREGDSVIIHFHNALPEPTTVHWHGVHLPAEADGSPLYPIAPGASHDYRFRLARGSAATYWYHPHPDRRSGYQIAMGLYGGIVVRAAADSLDARGIADKLLVLADNRFDSRGAVDFPDPKSVDAIVDLENGREGNVMLINGQVIPTISLRPGEVQRWRIVNASAARIYRLAIPGRHLVQVGTDGGLLEHPVELSDVMLANSERVEVLVRGGAPGDSAVLVSLPHDRYMPQTRPPDWNNPRPLLVVRTTWDSASPPATIPTMLRPMPALDTTHVAAHRVIVMSQGLIDGKQMDMHRVDTRSRLGTTEIWTIQNVVGMDHPFHLHGFHFEVLDRDGVPEPFRAWKDTGNVPKHSSMRIVVRFDDFPGRWMYHCHILDHEDQGMMGVLEVR